MIYVSVYNLQRFVLNINLYEGIYAIVMKTKSHIRNCPGEHTTKNYKINTNEVRKAPGTQGVALQDFKASTAPATKLSCQNI